MSLNKETVDPARAGSCIVEPDDVILITGATGFIGARLVENLLHRGFRNLRCLVRPSSETTRLTALSRSGDATARIEFVKGNLLSRGDCAAAVKDAVVIFHLAAARGEKSFPDAFMNSVVTTRNLLDACVGNPALKRFVNISSFSVYSNIAKPGGALLDESCPVEKNPELRWDAYCFAKVKQDEIVQEYGSKSEVPFVIVRPGYVYGPGNEGITGRVGIATFGPFLHMGGSNTIPFTYVDNCVEAIALAGLRPGITGEVFNVVDDDLPSSGQFLRAYKKNVQHFRSLYVPRFASYLLCALWERYAAWSAGQLEPVFNRRMWHAYWKKARYSNQKLKTLGWTPLISTAEAMQRFFEACKKKQVHA